MDDLRPMSGGRWELIRELLGPNTTNVLDVGCRGRELRPHLPGEYTGLDLQEPADVIASAEEPLPFGDNSFDGVVLADVLEHLNDPHGAIDEAMRVSSGAVVILLPNLYTLASRLRFMAGITMDKYQFGPENRVDRHRWLLNASQARAFTHGRAQANGWRVAREAGYLLPFRRRALLWAEHVLVRLSGPDVWAWQYVARLEATPK